MFYYPVVDMSMHHKTVKILDLNLNYQSSYSLLVNINTH